MKKKVLTMIMACVLAASSLLAQPVNTQAAIKKVSSVALDLTNKMTVNEVNKNVKAAYNRKAKVPNAKGKPIFSGSYKKSKWAIYKNGLLEVKGKGNMYAYDKGEGYPDWTFYAFYIKSARIKVTGATYLSHFFDACPNLRSIDLSKLDTSKVKDMNNMFYCCFELKKLDLSNFNTSKVKTMAYMFDGCKKLTSLNISNFDTSNVTTMRGMFQDCSKLTNLNLSSFNTSKVKDMAFMFYECRKLTSLDLNSFDTSKVKNMGYMFADCNKLTTLDLSSFDISNLKYMLYIFTRSEKIKTIKTPKKTGKKTPELPTNRVWEDSIGNIYIDFPENATESITLTGE